MLIKKIALIAIVITATGCANNEGLEASVSSLNQKVDTLTNKVNALTDEVAPAPRADPEGQFVYK